MDTSTKKRNSSVEQNAPIAVVLQSCIIDTPTLSYHNIDPHPRSQAPREPATATSQNGSLLSPIWRHGAKYRHTLLS